MFKEVIGALAIGTLALGTIALPSDASAHDGAHDTSTHGYSEGWYHIHPETATSTFVVEPHENLQTAYDYLVATGVEDPNWDVYMLSEVYRNMEPIPEAVAPELDVDALIAEQNFVRARYWDNVRSSLGYHNRFNELLTPGTMAWAYDPNDPTFMTHDAYWTWTEYAVARMPDAETQHSAIRYYNYGSRDASFAIEQSRSYWALDVEIKALTD